MNAFKNPREWPQLETIDLDLDPYFIIEETEGM